MRRSLKYGLAALAIVALVALVELALGRVPWCKCGDIKFWHGVVMSSENSQQITDWYTFSHIIHGVGFYFVLWLVGAHLPVGARFVLAVLLEGAWEVLENTPLIINRYRSVTIALDYFGDSVLNSVSDVIAMALGFWIARFLKVRTTVALVVALELMVLYFIRDNLTLNILMLLYPIKAIRQWQLGG